MEQNEVKNINNTAEDIKINHCKSRGFNYYLYKKKFCKQIKWDITRQRRWEFSQESSSLQQQGDQESWQTYRRQQQQKFRTWKQGYVQNHKGTMENKVNSRILWMECIWKEIPVKRKRKGEKMIYSKTRKRVQEANLNKYGSRPLGKVYDSEMIDNIISFEHINVDGLNTRDNLIEIQHLLGTLKGMETGVFSVNEHTLDTTQPQLMKDIRDRCKEVDPLLKL